MKILLISSTGGHFQALQKLEPFWGKHQCCWITFQTDYTERFLGDKEKVYWAYSPTNRNLPNLVCNLGLAWQVINRESPELVLSTGAGVAVPFVILAKIKGAKTVFIEYYLTSENTTNQQQLCKLYKINLSRTYTYTRS